MALERILFLGLLVLLRLLRSRKHYESFLYIVQISLKREICGKKGSGTLCWLRLPVARVDVARATAAGEALPLRRLSPCSLPILLLLM